jgi:hypothetical protein
MFTLDTTIDAVQTAKKQAINTVFAKQETIAKALTGFVDAQTAYTKEAVKAGTNAATTLASEVTKLAQEAAKTDYLKSFEEASAAMAKAFTVKK